MEETVILNKNVKTEYLQGGDFAQIWIKFTSVCRLALLNERILKIQENDIMLS